MTHQEGIPASPAAGLPPDVVAAWPAMCPPVRMRFLAEAQPHRARALLLRWLQWEARRRLAASAVEAPPLPAEPRILAIRPDRLGDALLTTPAYRLIKAALPGVYLTVLAGPWGADVPEHCPAVDRVRLCSFPGFEHATQGRGALARLRTGVTPYALLLGTATSIAEEGYDLAINFRPDYWWGAALAALARIPHRLGYATPETAPFLSHSRETVRLPVGAAGRGAARVHVAELSLVLARETLALAGRPVPDGFERRMAYEPAPAERAEAWRLWRAHDLDEAPAVVAIHPLPDAPAKRWPAQRFALVADHLAGRYGARVVITGGPADVAAARALAAACWHQPVVLAGGTTFGALAALLERCRFAIGTDNGAMHLATAMGLPNLRLFGPTDPVAWGAWTGQGEPGPGVAEAPPVTTMLACAPCHRLDLPPWETATKQPELSSAQHLAGSISGGGANILRTTSIGVLSAGGTAGSADDAYPCMQDISVERVIAAVETLWAATAGRPSTV